MYPPVRLLIAGLVCVASMASADDIRDKVQPAGEPSAGEAVIDTQGIVFGVPFGTSEDGMIQKFGPPAGYLRLDAHRTALLYGQSYLLLCYDGSLDGLRINRSAVDGQLSRWITESAPFLSQGWRLSNGLRPEMSLKAVKEIVKAEPAERKYRLDFSSDACKIQLSFSHFTNEGEGDEAYKINGLLMARTQEGKDHWSEPPTGRFIPALAPGKKVIGLRTAESPRGVRVTAVFQGGPADQAGIRPGDLLTALNGESVVGTSAAEFGRRVADGGDRNTVEVTSPDGARRTVSLTKVDGGSVSGVLVGKTLTVWEVGAGDTAPDFEAKSAEGSVVKLSELKGALVLVNFTATWCPPCKVETPLLAAAYAKYKDKGLKVLSVYLDGPGKDVFAYAKTLGADWPIHTDGKVWDNAVVRAYGVNGVPSNVLVGRDGKVLSTEARGPQLDAAIEDALK